MSCWHGIYKVLWQALKNEGISLYV